MINGIYVVGFQRNLWYQVGIINQDHLFIGIHYASLSFISSLAVERMESIYFSHFEFALTILSVIEKMDIYSELLKYQNTS